MLVMCCLLDKMPWTSDCKRASTFRFLTSNLFPWKIVSDLSQRQLNCIDRRLKGTQSPCNCTSNGMHSEFQKCNLVGLWFWVRGLTSQNLDFVNISRL